MNRFQTTRWSLVLDAAGQSPHARAALASLCATYRRPVLAYVRRHVGSADSAEDLTQAFFLQFIEHAWHAGADPARGRFRAYLLTAVRRFLIDQHVQSQRIKRGAGVTLEAIDAIAEAGIADSEDPEAVFNRDWALAVVDAALARLREEAAAAGKLPLFEQLREFLIERPADADYERAATRLNLRRNTLAVAVHRLRHRLRELVRAEIGETAHGRDALGQELHELRVALGTAAPT
ncbi:MAG: sigma-70 family RNA polymerase sigma factor [Dokdonella sp.]|nr:MAG: sigma-70 family RNA polymerase sigma factor [Dokdonella sp.]